jgi:ubiquinone/menaquinone biosynthesis C-methylase UbiE
VNITRSAFLLTFTGVVGLFGQERPPMHDFERQEVAVAGFDASGYILDIGGGGEGIIGRVKPSQVVAIDLFKEELLQAPPGPLKIVMDATDLKFLDGSFKTATAFYSLMYMKPDVQKKVFGEVFRVLEKGGRWLIWDTEIPAAMETGTRGPVFRFTFKLPKETVQTGYGTSWPDKQMDMAYYAALAVEAGFRVVVGHQTGGGLSNFSLELRKP